MKCFTYLLLLSFVCVAFSSVVPYDGGFAMTGANGLSLEESGWTVNTNEYVFFDPAVYADGTELAFEVPIHTVASTDRDGYAMAFPFDSDPGTNSVGKIILNAEGVRSDVQISFDYTVSYQFLSEVLNRKFTFEVVGSGIEPIVIFENIDGEGELVGAESGTFTQTFTDLPVAFELLFSSVVEESFEGPGVIQIDNIVLDQFVITSEAPCFSFLDQSFELTGSSATDLADNGWEIRTMDVVYVEAGVYKAGLEIEDPIQSIFTVTPTDGFSALILPFDSNAGENAVSRVMSDLNGRSVDYDISFDWSISYEFLEDASARQFIFQLRGGDLDEEFILFETEVGGDATGEASGTFTESFNGLSPNFEMLFKSTISESFDGPGVIQIDNIQFSNCVVTNEPLCSVDYANFDGSFERVGGIEANGWKVTTVEGRYFDTAAYYVGTQLANPRNIFEVAPTDGSYALGIPFDSNAGTHTVSTVIGNTAGDRATYEISFDWSVQYEFLDTEASARQFTFEIVGSGIEPAIIFQNVAGDALTGEASGTYTETFQDLSVHFGIVFATNIEESFEGPAVVQVDNLQLTSCEVTLPAPCPALIPVNFDGSFEKSGQNGPTTASLEENGWSVNTVTTGRYFETASYYIGTELAEPRMIGTVTPTEGGFALALPFDSDPGMNIVSRVITNTLGVRADYSITFDWAVTWEFIGPETQSRQFTFEIPQAGTGPITVFQNIAGEGELTGTDGGTISNSFPDLPVTFEIIFATNIEDSFEGPAFVQIDNITIESCTATSLEACPELLPTSYDGSFEQSGAAGSTTFNLESAGWTVSMAPEVYFEPASFATGTKLATPIPIYSVVASAQQYALAMPFDSDPGTTTVSRTVTNSEGNSLGYTVSFEWTAVYQFLGTDSVSREFTFEIPESGLEPFSVFENLSGDAPEGEESGIFMHIFDEPLPVSFDIIFSTIINDSFEGPGIIQIDNIVFTDCEVPCASSCDFLDSDVIMLVTDLEMCSASASEIILPTATTNVLEECGTFNVTSSPDNVLLSYPLGDTMIDVIVTSSLNPEDSVVCPITITVEDIETPQLSCPETQTFVPFFCEIVMPTFIYTDNCLDSLIVTELQTPSVADYGLNTFNVTITDGVNDEVNCNYEITVLDPFSFPNCPETNVTVPTDAQQCSAFVNVESEIGIVSETCPPNVLNTNYDAAGFEYSVGTTTYNAVANNAGVETFCSFDVVVVDVEEPVVTCPADVNVEVNDTAGAIVRYDDPEVVDNCLSQVTTSSTHDSGSFFSFGTTVVTINVSDGPNEANCSFNVILSLAASNTPTPTISITPTRSISRSNSPAGITNTASASPSRTSAASASRASIASASRSSAASASASASASRSSIASAAASASRSTASSASPSRSPVALVSASRSRSSAASASASQSRPASATRTPISASPSVSITRGNVFVQVGSCALVEMDAPCGGNTCSNSEIEFYYFAFAEALGASGNEVQVASASNQIIIFIVSDNEDTADVANAINNGTAGDSFQGVVIQDIDFDSVWCEDADDDDNDDDNDSSFEVDAGSSSSSAVLLGMSFVLIFLNFF